MFFFVELNIMIGCIYKKGEYCMNVAIVGAGEGGTNILETLHNTNDINVSCIIDRNDDAQGIVMAKKLGIVCHNDISEIRNHEVDVILEVTGIESVRDMLKEQFGDTCDILDSNAVKLISILVEQSKGTLTTLHKQIKGINNADERITEVVEKIVHGINNVEDVSNVLSKATTASMEYINETDNITNYVNKIAYQTKILGINASIESARAGEIGKSFAVVAKEVSKLAKDSGGFAEEINKTLSKMKEEMMLINNQIERLTQFSKQQVEASAKVQSALSDLKDIIE